MKRLFYVVSNEGKKLHNGDIRSPSRGGYYENKADAKKLRDEVNARGGRGCPYTIARGPDHWKNN